MSFMNRRVLIGTAAVLSLISHVAVAEVLPEAVPEVKIPLVKKPTTRPMSVAYVPYLKQYFIADGGLAPIPGDPMAASSQSEVHIYNADGQYVSSAKPGLDNRSIYYNEKTRQLESVTYNISSEAGFGPSTGIFSLILNDDGSLKNDANEITGHNPAFGSPGTIPSYDAENNIYFAKQERSNLVRVIESPKREMLREIKLDLKAAGTKMDEIAHYFVAYTGIKGEELALLGVDQKAVFIFNLDGKFVGKSALPSTLKLRSQNHINGTGYTNGLFFVYHEPEGEFGTYYGFRIVK